MIDRLEAVGIIVSLALLLLVLDLVRRQKLREEYSYLWMGCALAILGITVRRDVLHRVASWLGIYEPPNVLLLVLLVVVFIGSLSISVVLSRHRQQIERLMEDNAILSAELRELRSRRSAAAGTIPSETMIADTSEYGGDTRRH